MSSLISLAIFKCYLNKAFVWEFFFFLIIGLFKEMNNFYTCESIFKSLLVQITEVIAVQVCNSHEVMCCFYE